MITRLLKLRTICFMLLLLLVCTTAPVVAQSTAFSYQGKLADNGNPANGSYDFQFGLWDSLSGGTSVAPRNTRLGVAVTNGSFTVTLDFAATAFPGANRFLEIAVRPANTGSYTTLTPRQIITSSPYAIQTVNAQQLGGLPASRYVATDTNGNVGIGTPTPNTRLSLSGGPLWTENGWTASMNLQNVSALGWEANSSGQRFGIGQTDGGLYFFRTTSPFGTTTTPATYDMTITDSGNVGIGTTTPGFTLEVIGGVRSLLNVSTHFVAETTGGTNSWAKYIMKTPNRQWAIGTSQNFNGDQLYIADETAGQIRMAIDTFGDVGIGTTAPVERLHVVGNTVITGNVGIGTTNPTAKLHVVDFSTAVEGVSTIGFGVRGSSSDGAAFYGFSENSNGVVGISNNGDGAYFRTNNATKYAGVFLGNVYVNGTVTQTSDARLKQNISKLGYGLAEVLRLRPVIWRWKAHPESGEQLGLVAQEVEPVLPKLVSTAKDAEQMKGLNYTGLIPVLVKAIQEQQDQIKEQSRQLKMQQTQIERQQREIGALRRAVKARKSGIHNP